MPRYKTEICKTFWELGNCPYGKRCCFIHTERDPNTTDTAIDAPLLVEDQKKTFFNGNGHSAGKQDNQRNSSPFRKKIEPPQQSLSVSVPKFNPDGHELTKNTSWKIEQPSPTSPQFFFGKSSNYMIRNQAEPLPNYSTLIPRSRVSIDLESSLKDFGKWPTKESSSLPANPAEIDISLSKLKPLGIHTTNYEAKNQNLFGLPIINNFNNLSVESANGHLHEISDEGVAQDSHSIAPDMFKFLENLGI